MTNPSQRLHNLGQVRELSLEEARALSHHDPKAAWAVLEELFATGGVALPVGRCRGELLLLDIAPGLTELARAITGRWLPWQGKVFAAQGSGVNVFTRDSLALAHLWWPFYRGYEPDGEDTYRAFRFRTYTAPGLMNPDQSVLKLDYHLPENPAPSIRRMLDEIVQLEPGLFLGKAHLHWWWGSWQTVAFFTLHED